MRAYWYHGGQLECNVATERFREALNAPEGLLWVDIEDPEDTDVEILLEVFGLHPLTVEDCIMPNLRPKLEEFDRYLFVILQGLQRNGEHRLAPVELDVCIGSNFVITVRSDHLKVLDQECTRVEKQSPIIKRGPDFLFYSLADALIDSYFPVLEEVELRVDDLEKRLLADSSKETLTELFEIYNELVILRRTLAPHREILSRFNRGELPYIKASSSIYFRDIYDHLLRMSDMVDACREMTTLALEAHATLVSNKLNEIMKTMTAMATLAVPLILITGIYGMNFGENPFLGPRWIYHAMSIAFLAAVPVMFYYFRKYRWL
jgi:magnesium transporter